MSKSSAFYRISHRAWKCVRCGGNLVRDKRLAKRGEIKLICTSCHHVAFRGGLSSESEPNSDQQNKK